MSSDIWAAIDELHERIKQLEQQVAKLAVAPTPDAFDEFWEAYPRRPRDGKATARKAFSKQNAGAVLTGLYAWREAGAFNPEAQYIPHASTWINQKCFLDTPETYKGFKKPTIGGPTRKRRALDEWLADGS